ncbi:MAG: metallophosphoesterase family protein [Candidatus Thorarchaeota archaeon]|nr:MAG: metallophosphoesterase family protein [Candidatus Thorarchaeota archaeon]
MTVRIAHISDTHLGTRFRSGIKQNVWAEEMRIRLLENDFYERFEEVFQRIANADPPVKLVIHSGDLYDTPTPNNPIQPPVVAREVAISVLNEFIEKTGIPVLAIEGNHGLYRTLKVSLLDSLSLAVEGLDVFTQVDLINALRDDKPLKKSYDDLEVFCFPFIDHAVLEATDKLADFNEWITTQQTPRSDVPSIGVAHGMSQDKSLYSAILSMGYDYVALGHDHIQQKQSARAWYSGSIERWRFDEANHKKGYLIVEVAPGKQPKVTPTLFEFSRPVFDEDISIEPDDTVESVIATVESWLQDKGLVAKWNPATAARVRLTFQGESPRLSGLDLNSAMELFRAEVLRDESRYNVVQLVWPPKRSVIDHDSAAYPEIVSEYLIEDPEQDFRSYLESEELPEEYDSEKLISIAVKALQFAVSGKGEKLTPELVFEEEKT